MFSGLWSVVQMTFSFACHRSNNPLGCFDSYTRETVYSKQAHTLKWCAVFGTGHGKRTSGCVQGAMTAPLVPCKPLIVLEPDYACNAPNQ